MSVDPARSARLALAGGTFLTVLAWYALPDAVRSRPLRVALKTGLLGATVAGLATVPEAYSPFTPAPASADEPAAQLSPAAFATLATATAAASVGLTVWGEKAIFARGERRRAAGVRCAHTRLAAGLAAFSGLAALPDWGRLGRA